VHVLIEAFNKLTDGSAELMVYGDTSYAPNYHERLRQMAINPGIRFMGSFNNNRVYEILAETDVLFVPSIWYENSPLTIHEAALAGVPVITSNIGGMAELIERTKNGLLFQVEDASDLHEKMKLLIDNPRLIKKLKGKAEEVKSLEENAKELESIYLRLCNYPATN
ncbi:MAG TPA: glycosyltransferase, partial [Thermodesulfobacteriota bacterium]|nr:glycosyltransferase [Thermodesulfobacteriota bacterium]